MKCSLGISNFLEEISSLSHSVIYLYFFALITEEGFLVSPGYSLTEYGPLEKGMANHFSIPALRTHQQYKRQKDRTLKEELPRSVGAQYATGDQRRNNSRRRKGWNQSKNNTQLWVGLVTEARSDAMKSILFHRNLEC